MTARVDPGDRVLPLLRQVGEDLADGDGGVRWRRYTRSLQFIENVGVTERLLEIDLVIRDHGARSGIFSTAPYSMVARLGMKPSCIRRMHGAIGEVIPRTGVS